MADAGVVRDANRLPWLEPYRAPPRKKSNRSAGVAAAIGAIGLAAVVTLLIRDVPLLPADRSRAAGAAWCCPRPPTCSRRSCCRRSHVAGAGRSKPAEPAPPSVAARLRVPRRRIKAVPTSAAYREVVKDQTGESSEPDVVASEAALAIAALAAAA